MSDNFLFKEKYAEPTWKKELKLNNGSQTIFDTARIIGSSHAMDALRFWSSNQPPAPMYMVGANQFQTFLDAGLIDEQGNILNLEGTLRISEPLTEQDHIEILHEDLAEQGLINQITNNNE